MAARKPAAKPTSMTVEAMNVALESSKLELAQEITSQANTLNSLFESISSINLDSIKENFTEKLKTLSDVLNVESVKEQQKINDLISKRSKAEVELDEHMKDAREKINALSEEYNDKLSQLKKEYEIKSEDEKRNLEQRLADEGEAVLNDFLYNRGLTTVKTHVLEDLRAFKTSSEEEVNDKVYAAVEAAEAKIKSGNDTAKKFVSMAHEKEIAILQEKLAAKDSKINDLVDMVEFLKENGSNTLDKVAKVVGEAKTDVTNSFDQSKK